MLSARRFFSVADGANAVAGDPDFSDVTLLLSMDGTDGSSTFTDSSTNAFSVTANGNAQISVSESKFNQAGYFDGSGDYLSLGGQTELEYGAGDFTVEMWIYFSDTSNQRNFFDNRGSETVTTTGAMVIYYLSGSLRVFIGGQSDVITGGSLSANQWYHIAVCRDGTTLRLFVDGVQSGSSYTDTTTHQTLTDGPYIGASAGGAADFAGYIDDLRITKGVARYTTTFTPPTAAFPSFS